MTFRNLGRGILVGAFVITILFQFLFMLISPEAWVRSKYALKAGRIDEETVRTTWGRIRCRIVGLIGTMIGVLFLITFFISLTR